MKLIDEQLFGKIALGSDLIVCFKSRDIDKKNKNTVFIVKPRIKIIISV